MKILPCQGVHKKEEITFHSDWKLSDVNQYFFHFRWYIVGCMHLTCYCASEAKLLSTK